VAREISRWILVCQATGGILRIFVFVRRRLVGFSAQKNNRAHKRLPGMWRRGVEKPLAALVFVTSHLKNHDA
jgi:hypothetical protein